MEVLNKHLCNHQFLEVETQKCSFRTNIPNEHTLIYNDCEEGWCFAMITMNLVGGETTTLRGCESRSMLKHVENQAEIKANETNWQLSEPFFKQIRCSQIVSNQTVPDVNNTIRSCVDFKYTDANRIDRRAKICCCSGSDHCNEPIEWADLAVELESQLFVEGLSGETSFATTQMTIIGYSVLFVLLNFSVIVFGNF